MQIKFYRGNKYVKYLIIYPNPNVNPLFLNLALEFFSSKYYHTNKIRLSHVQLLRLLISVAVNVHEQRTTIAGFVFDQ